MAGSQRGRRTAVKRQRRDIARGQAHISASFNNTIVSITDANGNVLSWSSAGQAGFKGSRKSTPYAARLAGQTAARAAVDMGVVEVNVFVKGPGPGRMSAIFVPLRVTSWRTALFPIMFNSYGGVPTSLSCFCTIAD